jgi:hypothetical protein
MQDALDALAAIKGLGPKDAVIARALIRNRLIDGDAVLTVARDLALCGGEGLLEELMAAGQLDCERARRIEATLEHKIAEKRAAAAGPEGEPQRESASENAEETARWQTPSGRGPRVWQPRGRRSSGESSEILLKEIKEELARKEGRPQSVESEADDALEKPALKEEFLRELLKQVADDERERERLQKENARLSEECARLKARLAKLERSGEPSTT